MQFPNSSDMFLWNCSVAEFIVWSLSPGTHYCVTISICSPQCRIIHYTDVIMSAMASQITGVSIVSLTVCSGADQRKHQRSASLTFVRGICRWPVDSPHNGPVTWKMFPFDCFIVMLKFSWNADGYMYIEFAINSSFFGVNENNLVRVWERRGTCSYIFSFLRG